mgnify:CR=1 FL=1
MEISKAEYRQALRDRKKDVRSHIRQEIHIGTDLDFQDGEEFAVLRALDVLIKAEQALALKINL